MSDMLPYDPTNRKLWDDNTLSLLWYWWGLGLYSLLCLAMAYFFLMQMPQYYIEMREHQTLIADGVIGEAIIDSCSNLSHGLTILHYDFTSAGGTAVRGHSTHWGNCAEYPHGALLTIRYLPANPSISGGVDEFNLSNAVFYILPLGIIGWLYSALAAGRNCIVGMLLAAKGRVRIGRIVSVKPIFNFSRIVRYEVTADDGTVRKGSRAMQHKGIVPDLSAGAPIPVLYANKWVHMPFGLRPPREPRPIESA